MPEDVTNFKRKQREWNEALGERERKASGRRARARPGRLLKSSGRELQWAVKKLKGLEEKFEGAD